jgi:DNA-binding NarL/FixJ family response regulator
MIAPELHVLLVEDNPGDARLVSEMLRETLGAKARLSVAARLAEAQAFLPDAEVQVVLLDLSLPDSHGLGTFGALHTLAPNLPIVVLTGLNDEQLAIDAVQQGAQDYLVKGEVAPESLGRALRYAIERQQLVVRVRQAEEERAQARKLQGVLELAQATCHELNQPLQILTAYLPLCTTTDPDSEEFRLSMQILAEQVQRLCQLANKLNRITRYETREYPGAMRQMIDLDRASTPRESRGD